MTGHGVRSDPASGELRDLCRKYPIASSAVASRGYEGGLVGLGRPPRLGSTSLAPAVWSPASQPTEEAVERGAQGRGRVPLLPWGLPAWSRRRSTLPCVWNVGPRRRGLPRVHFKMGDMLAAQDAEGESWTHRGGTRLHRPCRHTFPEASLSLSLPHSTAPGLNDGGGL